MRLLTASPSRPGEVPPSRAHVGRSLQDLGHDAGADGLAAFADREPEALFHGDRRVQLDGHLDVVARHAHLGLAAVLGQEVEDRAGHVGGPEVELGTITLEERRVAAAFVLGEDVDLGLELGVRRDRARLADDLAALEVVLFNASQENADVVAGLALVERLLEHLDAGDDRGSSWRRSR